MGLAKRPLGAGGPWFFGWGPQDDDASIAAIRHSVALGVNWIDTAAVYGLGHSEVVVGRAVREIPATDRPYVFTKCGLEWDEANPLTQPKRTLRPERIKKECEDSLKRLGLERIDLYQFHWPDEGGVPVEASWGVMTRLIEEGKVRSAGVSNFNLELLDRCEALRHVDSLQPPFSLVRRDLAGAQLPWCARHRTGVIVYSPMQSGLLTDGFSEERVAALAPDDWRRRSPEYQAPKLARNLALRDALEPIAERHGVTVAATAVAWTLAWPGVSGAIVGARSPEQVDGWVRAASLELEAAELDAIAQAIDETGAGSGPRRPA